MTALLRTSAPSAAMRDRTGRIAARLLRAVFHDRNATQAQVFLDSLLAQLAELGVTPSPPVTEPPAAIRDYRLSAREVQILRGIGDAMSNAEIGRELFISEDTVKSHARQLFKKLGARDRTHALAIAFRAGLLT